MELGTRDPRDPRDPPAPWTRACLAELAPLSTPQDRCDAIRRLIAGLLADRSALSEEKRTLQERSRAQVQRDFQLHYKLACLAVCAEKDGLLGPLGCETAAGLLGAMWQGAPPCDRFLLHYL